ncbi:hypothetical protein HDV02_002016 [Globomyces sp. JEL0801]|nr:hypothetical protein HDV02_002016 [Globomyces sp. JEL0801]
MSKPKNLLVSVGTLNPAKLRAVENALLDLSKLNNLPFTFTLVDIQGVACDSKVNHQPLSDPETMQGAINRANGALEINPKSDFGIGIESGINQIGDRWFESGWVAVIDQNGVIGLGSSNRYEISSRLMVEILKGRELSEVVDDVLNVTDLRSTSGLSG